MSQSFPPNGAQYPGAQYPNQQYPNQQYPNQYSYPQQGVPGPASPGQGYPGQGYPPRSHPAQGPVFQARFKKHTGMIVLAQWQTRTVVGSYEDVKKAYREAQTHNLVAGWWGLISLLVYNWIAIFGNMSEMGRIKKQAQAAGIPT
ncbi:hypothetical protein GCM10023147_51990 [Tsukamurella soli]|uniref:Uncharacterized protein n=1 Tax=Tsukamurella soli TaxID=644556 RepID=A0ABP8KJH2_9ACTN